MLRDGQEPVPALVSQRATVTAVRRAFAFCYTSVMQHEPGADQASTCLEKARLLDAFMAATSEYSRVINVLSRRMGVLLKSQYAAIRAFSETARLRSEAARLNFERHVAEHGC